MIDKRARLRKLALASAIVLVAGCKMIPKRPPVAPQPVPTEAPIGTLPADRERHRIALLVPLSGANAGVGQSLANATTMALLDTSAANLGITTYDTATGAQSAAARALADGTKLILGPLLNEDVRTVASLARPANVPMITFSNDSSVAADDVFVLGHVPAQAVARVVSFAKSRGMNRFAALVPGGEYGQRAGSAFTAAVRAAGGTIVARICSTLTRPRSDANGANASAKCAPGGKRASGSSASQRSTASTNTTGTSGKRQASGRS